MYQNLSKYKIPPGFRGRSALNVQLWWLTQSLIFKKSPQFMYGFRAWLLRLFGAKVGKKTVIRPSVTITYPWKVSIGDYAQIGDDVVIYSLGPISIGTNTVISQRSYLCAGDHDHTTPAFTLRGHPLVIEDQVWVGTDVFVAPGITIAKGAVVGARSSVFKDLPSAMVCMGSPCKPVKPRPMKFTN